MELSSVLESSTRRDPDMPMGRLKPAHLSSGILVEREFAMRSDKVEV